MTRGSRGDHRLFRRFRLFIGQDDGRFTPLADPDGRDDGGKVGPPIPADDDTPNRAGWKWLLNPNEAGERLFAYGIFPGVFDAEIATPLRMDGKDARMRLGAAGMIRGQMQDGRMRWILKPRRIPLFGWPRLVVTDASVLEGGGDE